MRVRMHRPCILKLGDDILGLVFDQLVQPVPAPRPDRQLSPHEVIGDPSLLSALRSLCLVSRRIMELARPRLYRNIAIPRARFHRSQPAVAAETMTLLGRTLLRSGLHTTSGFAAETGPLAEMVRSLHIWIFADGDTIKRVQHLLNACSNITMASLSFCDSESATPQDVDVASLYPCLERLDKLSILTWRFRTDEHMEASRILAPLLSIDLPHLQSLAIKVETVGPVNLVFSTSTWPKTVPRPVPRLRHFELSYVSWPDYSTTENSEPSTRAWRKQLVRAMLDLLDQSPNMASLELCTNILGYDICEVVPLQMARSLKYLTVSDASCNGTPLDLGPLSAMTGLVSFKSQYAVQERGLYSLPPCIAALTLPLYTVGAMTRLTGFLSHEINLPALRTLNIRFQRDSWGSSPAYQSEHGTLFAEWKKLYDGASSRGIVAGLKY